MLGNIKATKGHRNSSDQTVDSSEDAGIHPQRRQLHWEEGNADEKCHTLLPMTGTYFEDLNPGSFLHQYIDISCFLCLEQSSPRFHKSCSLASFHSLFKCLLHSEGLPGPCCLKFLPPAFWNLLTLLYSNQYHLILPTFLPFQVLALEVLHLGHPGPEAYSLLFAFPPEWKPQGCSILFPASVTHLYQELRTASGKHLVLKKHLSEQVRS